MSAALVDALQSDRRTGDLKKNTFRDFQRLTGYFSQTTSHSRQTTDRYEESSVLGYAGRDDHPADGAR